MFRKKLTSTAAILGLLLFALLAISSTVKADSHAPDAIWVEPSSLNLTTSTPVGAKFNVTVYTNMSVSTYTWQVNITFNVGQIQVVRADYTGVGKSLFFTGHTTIPVVAQISNVTGFVQFGESLVGVDTRAAATGSLMWAEFQIMAGPTSNNSLTSALNINSSDTYMLDPDLNEIANVQKFGASYSYSIPVDTTPPTISGIQQNPSGSYVAENQSVTVSANVTDDLDGSGVKNVTLSYTNDTTWNDVPMTLSGELWTGVIPGFLNGTMVKYNITAFDNAGNGAANDNAGQYYSYSVVPEFTPVILIIFLMMLSLAVIAGRKKFTR